MSASFIITFCAAREQQLLQCLRFLTKNEPSLSQYEVVLICQDQAENKYPYKLINLKLNTYNRPFMINQGVLQSTWDILVLLDGDRILPYKYFENRIRNIKPRDVITPLLTRRLVIDVEDWQIENGDYPYFEDPRSQSNEFLRKNLFSGNTIMHRKDFMSCGGMDESFEGYGFNDHDMTTTALKFGCHSIFTDDVELHLHHPKNINWDNESLEHTRIMSAINFNRYAKKWNVYPQQLIDMNQEIILDIEKYPENLKNYFLETYKQIKILT